MSEMKSLVFLIVKFINKDKFPSLLAGSLAVARFTLFHTVSRIC